MNEERLKTLLSFAAALAVLGLFTNRVGWSRITESISGAHPPGLAAAFALLMTSVIMMALAWGAIVGRVADLQSPKRLLTVFYATQFANGITPFGQLGGEPFVAYLLSKTNGTPLSKGLGALLVADLVNTVPFFTLSIAGIGTYLALNPTPPALRTTLLLILTTLTALLAALYLLQGHREKGEHLAGTVGSILHTTLSRLHLPSPDWASYEATAEQARNFFEAFDQAKSSKTRVLKALFLTHLSMLLASLGLLLLTTSLHHPVPLSVALFVVPVAALGNYAPLPGGTGGVEILTATLLTTFGGVPPAPASAAAILFRVPRYWTTLLVGGISTSRQTIGAR